MSLWKKRGRATDSPPEAVLRCSFCNLSQRDVKKLIAGPTVYICNECVEICQNIIAEDATLADSGKKPPNPPAPSESEATCVLCRQVREKESMIYVLDRGLICLICVDRVREAAGQAWEEN
jgi:hypothetical protein